VTVDGEKIINYVTTDETLVSAEGYFGMGISGQVVLYLEHTDCVDGNNDHKCDVCGKTISDCGDTDNNHNCDVCGKTISDCTDTDNNHSCDICGGNVGVHEAVEDSHDCAYCGEPASECADGDNDHKCDVCGETVCVDEDTDHECDVCGETVGEHKAAEGSHDCAYCGEELSDCVDDNNDLLCDVCGEPQPTTVAVSTMFADANKWKLGGTYTRTDSTKVPSVTIANSILTLAGQHYGSWSWYNGAVYKNTKFTFTYKQTSVKNANRGSVGFILSEPYEGLDAVVGTNAQANQLGQVINGAKDGIYVEFGDKILLVKVKDGVAKTLKDYELKLADATDYAVTFALYDISATEAKVVVTVGADTIFDETITDEEFVNAEGYFGIGVASLTNSYIG